MLLGTNILLLRLPIRKLDFGKDLDSRGLVNQVDNAQDKRQWVPLCLSMLIYCWFANDNLDYININLVFTQFRNSYECCAWLGIKIYKKYKNI